MSFGPDTSLVSWRALKRELSQAAFLARFAHPFLVLGEAAQEPAEDFFTQHVALEHIAGAAANEEQEVIPLVKGDSNPYADRIIIGRARNCDVVFRTPGISKVHAEFRLRGLDAGAVIDRGSTNGTFVQGKQVVPGKLTPVTTGEAIQFAVVHCLFLSPAALWDRL